MMERIFSKDRVNTGRQREIDLLKAYSIIMMIITHCIDDLFIYENHLPSVIIDDILAQSVGAQGFMICMGCGILFWKSRTPKTMVNRGLMLLLTGQVLNIVRSVIPYTIIYLLTGDRNARGAVLLVFSSDILQFAGLFMIVMALFTCLKLKSWHVFLISIGCNIMAMLLALKISTGSYLLDQFIGLFIFTRAESYFPLLHWMIYPAFGMVFGDILQHVKDKTRFYAWLLVPCSIVAVFYFYVGLAVDQEFFTVFNVWQTFCCMSIYDALPQLFCNVGVICLCYFITFRLSKEAMKPINFISVNINRYYCIHYVFIAAINSVFIITGVWKLEKAWICYLTALFITLGTTLVIRIYDAKAGQSLRDFLSRRVYIWAVLVVLISLAAFLWAEAGFDGHYPTLHNDYEEYEE